MDRKQVILVIDDETSFLEIFSKVLTLAGFEVITAQDGEGGIAMAKEKLPDLVLLDVGMPGLDGFDVLTRMQADPKLKYTKIVFLTNYGEPIRADQWIDKKFAQQAGAIDYIRKSDDLSDIVKAVEDIFQKYSIGRKKEALEE